MQRQMIDNVLVLAGAVIGGTIGFFIFIFLYSHGYYALAIPGAFAGFGAGFYRTDSKITPVICGVIALISGLLAEGIERPFIADESLTYFFSHLHQLSAVTIIMLVFGTAVGFWIPFNRTMKPRRQLRHTEKPE